MDSGTRLELLQQAIEAAGYHVTNGPQTDAQHEVDHDNKEHVMSCTDDEHERRPNDSSSPSSRQRQRQAPAGERVVKRVKDLCLIGIPDLPRHVRPLAYLILLNLPPVPQLVQDYQEFVQQVDHLVSQSSSPQTTSTMSNQDQLLIEIQRDVVRTFGTLDWFNQPVSHSNQQTGDTTLWNRVNQLVDQNATPQCKLPQTRRQLLLRPLFVFATLNPGVGYVQGMNHLAAVLFWIFSNLEPVEQSNESNLERAEACCFFSLGQIISQLRDLYLPIQDHFTKPQQQQNDSLSGLQMTMNRFMSLLNWLDPDISNHLISKQVEPHVFCLRWLTTMFANEFTLPDLVRIWDRVLSLYPTPTSTRESTTREALSPILSHLLDLSISILILKKKLICSPYSNFSKILKTLQNQPIETEQIESLLQIAWKVREKRLGQSNQTFTLNQLGGTPSSDQDKVEDGSNSSWIKWAQTKANQATNTSSLKSRLFSTSSSSSTTTQQPLQQLWSTSRNSKVTPRAVADFELEETSSSVDGESQIGSPNIDDRTQYIQPSNHVISSATTTTSLQSPRVLTGRQTDKGLDGRITLAELIEAELPPLENPTTKQNNNDDEQDDYQIDSDEEENHEEANFENSILNLRDKAKQSWQKLTLSDTVANLSKTSTNLQIKASLGANSLKEKATNSDTIANLSKKSTNLSIQANLLFEKFEKQAPERLNTLKDTVSNVSGRFVASTDSSNSTTGYRDSDSTDDMNQGLRRPGSPIEQPFTPPRWSMRAGPGTIRRPPSPTLQFQTPPPPTTTTANYSSESMKKSWSNGSGPKPLLLSSNGGGTIGIGGRTRRGSNTSDTSISNSPSIVNTNTKRSSIVKSSPSTSPQLMRSNLPSGSQSSTEPYVVPILNHGSSSSSSSSTLPNLKGIDASATTTTTNSKLLQSENEPIESLRILKQRQTNSLNEVKPVDAVRVDSSVPSLNGRGWTLSDEPVNRYNQDQQQDDVQHSFDSDSLNDNNNNNNDQKQNDEIQISLGLKDQQQQTDTTTTNRPPRASSLSHIVTTSLTTTNSKQNTDFEPTMMSQTYDEDQPLSVTTPTNYESFNSTRDNHNNTTNKNGTISRSIGIVRRPGAIKKRNSSSTQSSFNSNVNHQRFSHVSNSSTTRDHDEMKRYSSNSNVSNQMNRASLVLEGRNSMSWETGQFVDAYGDDGVGDFNDSSNEHER
ncbi:hypothetical protein OIO90_002905 [Microbotryomycetes sp. JL221]|nr:hypothetical protein OIO90_002905 [Microbotryomycetes sp. JL221]